ncbi:YihY/virulence factor BrkB family protein [Planctomonas psychrotolerans]|uniref:YihY/virulence factor BrkB family protein n=1 Tax=Planctomonas psychrotolerans TaxID=2528712 RepID=UPI00123BEEC1|nr:YihY/virulence factor BrkB family protein [Planctomonas psychrotolerans]
MTNATDRSAGSGETGGKDDATARPTGFAGLVDRVFALRPVRVFFNYLENGGDVLAAGMSYQAIFAVFGALWVGFSVAGLFLQSNRQLQDALFDQISLAVPGLISRDDESEGAIDVQRLLDTGIFEWTSAIAVAVVLFTALAWLAYTRDAIRRIFELPPPSAFFLLLKVKDFGIAIGFGLALVLSAALSVASTEALGFVFRLVGIDENSLVATVVARASGLLVVLLLDTAVLSALYRVLSGVRIPLRRLLGGALIGAVAMGTLKVLGSTLLGGASRNPLLASFAVIIGLLIWFNLMSRVILICASWIAVGMEDDDVPARNLSPEQRARERAEAEKEARVLVAEADLRQREQDYAHAWGLGRWFAGRRLERQREEVDAAKAAVDDN